MKRRHLSQSIGLLHYPPSIESCEVNQDLAKEVLGFCVFRFRTPLWFPVRPSTASSKACRCSHSGAECRGRARAQSRTPSGRFPARARERTRLWGRPLDQAHACKRRSDFLASFMPIVEGCVSTGLTPALLESQEMQGAGWYAVARACAARTILPPSPRMARSELDRVWSRPASPATTPYRGRMKLPSRKSSRMQIRGFTMTRYGRLTSALR